MKKHKVTDMCKRICVDDPVLGIFVRERTNHPIRPDEEINLEAFMLMYDIKGLENVKNFLIEKEGRDLRDVQLRRIYKRQYLLSKRLRRDFGIVDRYGYSKQAESMGPAYIWEDEEE